MARIRSIKPDIWDDEAFGMVSCEAQLLFIGLVTQADDDGRQKMTCERLRAKLWPYKTDLHPTAVAGWLDELIDVGLVIRYEVDGRQYLFLRTWFEHQKINRPRPSLLPSPPNHGMFSERSVNAHGALGAEVEVEVEEEVLNPNVELKLNIVAKKLFNYWQQQCDHPAAKFTRDRQAKVLARLREGYTEEQIRRGIDGAAVGAFINDQGKRFDDLELICRNGSKLEGFIDRAQINGRVEKSTGDWLARLNKKKTT